MSPSFSRSTRLFTPGPTPVPHFAKAALQETNVYHRSEAFYKTLKACRHGLAPFFGTVKNEPLILTSSGTGAMEAAMVNLTAAGDKVIVVNGGKFGERWEKLAKGYGCETITLTIPWGESPDLSSLVRLVETHRDAKALFIQANETSTGVSFPLADIMPVLRSKTEALLVVDAISGMVAHEIHMDRWGLDCVVSGSQKGFGIPPGLAFIALSERAWQRLSKRPRFYFDLARERKEQETGSTAWTPATTLVAGLALALEHLQGIGPVAAAAYHARLAKACQAAAHALGLPLFAKTHPSHALTAIVIPDGIDGSTVVKTIRQRFHAIMAGGQDHMKGKLVRLSHLGFTDELDLIAGLAAFEFGLAAAGYRFHMGAGVTAAMQNLA